MSMGPVACLRSPVPAELLSAGWGCMQHVATGGTAHAHFITHAHVMNSWFKFRQCPSGQAFNTLGAAPAGPLAPFGVQLFCAQRWYMNAVHAYRGCSVWLLTSAAPKLGLSFMLVGVVGVTVCAGAHAVCTVLRCALWGRWVWQCSGCVPSCRRTVVSFVCSVRASQQICCKPAGALQPSHQLCINEHRRSVLGALRKRRQGA